jgi:CRISPR-associated protein Csb2
VRYGELAGDRGEIETLSEKRKSLDEQRRVSKRGLEGAEKKAAEAVFVKSIKEIDTKMTACHQELQERFQGRIPITLRPEPGLWKGYERPAEQVKDDTPRSIFDPRLMVLALSGKKLSLPATLKLTETMRGALFATCPQPIPEWLSGHTTDGKPTALPHTAFIPLPFVGSNHADGRLMGIALVLPRDLDPSEANRCLDPFFWDMETGAPAQIHLFAGQWFECQAEQEQRESPPWNLRAEAWTVPSRIWASITPVTLDRHFDGKRKWDLAAESVKDSCERIGLPRPNEVVLHPVSLVEGVPHSREFPHLTRKRDGGQMHHTHAVIVFEKPVFGPVLVGAGRYRGYGLCRPMDKREAEYA